MPSNTGLIWWVKRDTKNGEMWLEHLLISITSNTTKFGMVGGIGFSIVEKSKGNKTWLLLIVWSIYLANLKSARLGMAGLLEYTLTRRQKKGRIFNADCYKNSKLLTTNFMAWKIKLRVKINNMSANDLALYVFLNSEKTKIFRIWQYKTSASIFSTKELLLAEVHHKKQQRKRIFRFWHGLGVKLNKLVDCHGIVYWFSDRFTNRSFQKLRKSTFSKWQSKKIIVLAIHDKLEISRSFFLKKSLNHSFLTWYKRLVLVKAENHKLENAVLFIQNRIKVFSCINLRANL